jgi:pimeloyl-ACP methyl ester carboxylesterase
MKIEINGIEINYEVSGQGAPVVLLHGWGCSTRTMQPIGNGLGDMRTVYNIDFPGFGESTTPPKPWSVTEYTDCLVALLQKLALGKVDIVAHSFGGRVTLLLASTRPEMVGKIVITGGAGLRAPRGFKYYSRVYTYKLGKKMLKHPWMVSTAKTFGVDLQKRAASAGSQEYRELSGVMKQTFVRVVNQDLHYCLPQIKSSTLLIWGENDGEAPLWMGKTMEKEIKDAGLVVFEGRGHYAYLEELPRFMKIVRTFLG